MVIETERLSIRVSEDADAPAFLEIHRDPEVMRWLGGAQPKDLDDELERIASRRAMQRDLGFTLWTVEEKESGVIAGLAGLFPVEQQGPDVEVAYHFAKRFWGRGYATEAARACIDYGFEIVGLERIVGLVHPDNEASARVLEKCGMTFEGTGHYYDADLRVYALTRGESL